METGQEGHKVSRLLHASMGPWRLSHGDLSAAQAGRSTRSRFKGAKAMKPWRPVIVTWKATGNITLQWGHGGEAMETIDEPQPYVNYYVLQWGHGG